ncbi:restriction endonuclease [Magnetospirillum fulvum]|uniref:Restriction system protein n=1 Tax=Magnetospirillum fulvum MGU-K5 TaxID=1316936 RepID=S9TGE8_MAGFU|nr:restriction endonuclease [Magnetospirillum fulvum]EPY01356.1 restriction system protein [Magnetospirillum fulvum MGU-K5]
MADASTNDRLREWLIRVFSQTISKISNEEDRHEISDWLSRSRDVLASDGTKREKFTALYALTDTKKSVGIVARSVVETVKNFKNSDLPLSVKIAVPVTLLAAPFVGGQGAGVAALGGALGLPVLLLVFLGSAGITSILESLAKHKEAAPYLMGVLEIIARDEIARRTSAELKAAMRDEPIDSRRFTMPAAEVKLRQKLLSMDPFDFELHVVSFFKSEGVKAWATRKSNDLGVDGFVDHPDGLIVIQCKRHSPDNPVGGPLVQQFKGVIEENGAARGYLVTTSSFTSAAMESAEKSDRLELVDMDGLVRWHSKPPAFPPRYPP